MARRSRPRRGRDQPRHRFRSRPGNPGKQAAAIMKRLQGGRVRSVGTARNYQQRLVQIAARLDMSLTALTPAGAVAYLQRRAAEVGQKTLDMERQAIQAMMLDVTLRMAPGQTLPVVKSATPQQLKPPRLLARPGSRDRRPPGPPATRSPRRSCTPRGSAPTSCSRSADRPSSRPTTRRGQSRLTGTAAEGMKFAGRDGVVYTVIGKGGLVREVLLPHGLAERLEARRRDAPERVVDRGVRYLQRYDLGGGHAFSTSFSRASIEALGKSRGAHGMRHRFAQERMRELMHHAEHRLALAIVSEELGHLRPDVVQTYLR